MEFISNHLLSAIVFLPTIFAVILLFFPTKEGEENKTMKIMALVFSLIVFLISCVMYNKFDPSLNTMQFLEKKNWITNFGISYSMCVDGISLLLIMLTTFITPVAILGTWNAIEKNEKIFLALILFLETGMLGAFCASDMILFYIFWEMMLIPMYLMIGVWGGKERIYAANKFFIFTLVGSLLMLVAMFYLMNQYKIQFGNFSADLAELYKLKIPFDGLISAQTLLFLAFALAFAIKVPLFPLHTWLPDAHVQAPTAGSVILAGVLLKLGGYGFIRFAFPLFPQAVQFLAPTFMSLGAIAIVYGAWVAMVQPDIKKLVAYSSVSHMGYVILGLFSMTTIGISGSVYQMLNHGISTGGLFLIVGMIYERRHTREITEFGGITKIMPLFAISFMIITLSSIALPGTNGFIGEFLILLGTFQYNKWIAIIAGTGVIFGAVYMLWMFQRVMFGENKNPKNKDLKDLSAREVWVMVPIIAAIFIMGIFPNLFLSKMDSNVKVLVEQLKGKTNG